MPSTLHDALASCRDRIGDEVFTRLHGSTAVHYRHIEEEVLRARADRLVDQFLASLSGKPAVFIDYISTLAGERIGEGFFLREIQLALSILEEQAWELVVANLPAREHVAALGIVTGVVGAAKDRLAQVYLEHLEEARAAATDLRQRCEVLARGTESGPVTSTAYQSED